MLTGEGVPSASPSYRSKTKDLSRVPEPSAHESACSMGNRQPCAISSAIASRLASQRPVVYSLQPRGNPPDFANVK